MVSPSVTLVTSASSVGPVGPSPEGGVAIGGGGVAVGRADAGVVGCGVVFGGVVDEPGEAGVVARWAVVEAPGVGVGDGVRPGSLGAVAHASNSKLTASTAIAVTPVV